MNAFRNAILAGAFVLAACAGDPPPATPVAPPAPDAAQRTRAMCADAGLTGSDFAKCVLDRLPK